MKIVAFGASTSKKSINKTFANYVAKSIANTVELLDLNDYPLPLYSVDYEAENGIPENSVKFYNKIQEADLLVISIAEHNGTYTAAFKNLFDWTSRYQAQFFTEKKIVLASTSPGARGGQGAMDAALDRFPRHGAKILGNFVFPSFQDNFSTEKGITNQELNNQFKAFIHKIKESI